MKLTMHGIDQVSDGGILINGVIAGVLGERAVELDIEVAMLAVSTAVPSSAFGIAGTGFVNVRWHYCELLTADSCLAYPILLYSNWCHLKKIGKRAKSCR